MPQHAHALNASANAAVTPVPIDTVPGVSAAVDPTYEGGANVEAMATGAVTPFGGGQAHENMMPFLALNFIIALRGLFPSRT